MMRMRAAMAGFGAVVLVGCSGQAATPQTAIPQTVTATATSPTTIAPAVADDPSAAQPSNSAAVTSSIVADGGAEFLARMAAAGLTHPDYDYAKWQCSNMDRGTDPAGLGRTLDLYTTLSLSSATERQWMEIAIATVCPRHQAAWDEAKAKQAAGPATADEPGRVTYSVTATDADSALITYTEEDKVNLAQENDAALPWTKDAEVSGGNGRLLNLSAQSRGGGDITCAIAVGGQVVDTATASGEYAVVTCSV